MKRKFIFLFLFVSVLTMQAQNLQLHFDGRNALYGDRHFSNNYLTATFEMFKPDKWGSTFMFVDADFNLAKGNIGLMYTEIARDFKIGKFPLLPHIEYNGGLGLFEINKSVGGGYSIPNAYLAGFSYPFNIGKVSFGTTLSYKYNSFVKTSHDVQFTLTWFTNLLDNKLTLSGFADFWTENKNPALGTNDKKLVFISEPQVWFNINEKIAIGGEVEITSNFAGKDRIFVCPTLGAKWTF